ncbi:probable transcription factor At5g28040 [Salvia splendens]|uniref:probable transcription factor At5g28040 n=1 Tax=Salvia splendens TaxID=180675 RepID=UPI001C25E5CD|nr:probable transcription factor At5g28040 [Salvia splendens]XP_042041834.1 probable transcription factor At5g28040 [Salvia splendens]
MDSTLIQSPNNKTYASKLPIKRKTPDPIPPNTPPFKFHRIWTESDEIRFLQGLLDCSSHNLAFPRDLGIFYTRFSHTMSQPYTKSQLSEKLRRLRKKFRVISTRLSKGMDPSQLSLHDRALHGLSKRLWHPEFAAISPFSGARNVGLSHGSNAGGGGDGNLKKSSLVGIKVDFSPTLPVMEFGNSVSNCGNEGSDDRDDEVKLSEVNVEFEGKEATAEDEALEDAEVEVEARQNVDFRGEIEIGEVAAKVVMNVFDECLKEVRRVIGGGMGSQSFHARWRDQRIAELDVLGSRLSPNMVELRASTAY